MEHRPPIQFTGCRPVLPVKDVAASLGYYTRVLGFTKDWQYSNDSEGLGAEAHPTFAYVFRGDYEMFLEEHTEVGSSITIVLGLRSLDEVDRIHEEYEASGAKILEPPGGRPWGTYEMAVTDLDGHIFRILTNLPESADKGA